MGGIFPRKEGKKRQVQKYKKKKKNGKNREGNRVAHGGLLAQQKDTGRLKQEENVR